MNIIRDVVIGYDEDDQPILGWRGDNDVSTDLDSADRGIDHAPTWLLRPGWHTRGERIETTRSYLAGDVDGLQDGPPMSWEDPDFEVTGLTGWNDDTCDGGAL